MLAVAKSTTDPKAIRTLFVSHYSPDHSRRRTHQMLLAGARLDDLEMGNRGVEQERGEGGGGGGAVAHAGILTGTLFGVVPESERQDWDAMLSQGDLGPSTTERSNRSQTWQTATVPFNSRSAARIMADIDVESRKGIHCLWNRWESHPKGKLDTNVSPGLKSV